MPPGHQQFLAAITAYPEDDLPRLVFADWLDENGDSDRAEFIRLHCERWRTKEKKRYPQRLRDRIAPLREANEAAWRAELPPLPGVEWGRYWRGFVSEAKFATPFILVEKAAAAFAATPIQMVQVSGLAPDSVDAVCGLPQLENLYGLRLDAVSLDLDMWRKLTGSDWFGRLRHLIAHPMEDESSVSSEVYGVNLDERCARGEEIMRLVLAAASRPTSQLKIAHLDLLVDDVQLLRNTARGRVLLSGLDDWKYELI
jgi:uncharacterized protein (TIGR02996 family)